jgi:hypothetical protein
MKQETNKHNNKEKYLHFHRDNGINAYIYSRIPHCKNWSLLLYVTRKKENKIFLIYKKKIQMASGAKSYMRKGFLIYEEMHNISPYMRRALVIYDFAPDPSEFPNI